MLKVLLHISLLVGLLLFPALGWADYQAGLDAYVRGDYDTALAEFRPLAEQGNALAQSHLGLLYEIGAGVTQDSQEAVRWFRLAAEQGDVNAQYHMGVMYFLGSGVPIDDAMAHMWMNLAAAKGNDMAVEMRDKLESLMTPQQIAEAQRLAREWKAKGR